MEDIGHGGEALSFKECLHYNNNNFFFNISKTDFPTSNQPWYILVYNAHIFFFNSLQILTINFQYSKALNGCNCTRVVVIPDN